MTWALNAGGAETDNDIQGSKNSDTNDFGRVVKIPSKFKPHPGKFVWADIILHLPESVFVRSSIPNLKRGFVPSQYHEELVVRKSR